MVKVEQKCYSCGGQVELSDYRTEEIRLCKKCYDWHNNIAKTGIPSLEQIEENQELSKEYYSYTLYYLLLMKKRALTTKEKPSKILKEVFEAEEDFSILLLAKDKSTLNFKEHMMIIKEVIEDLELEDYSQVTMTSRENDKYREKIDYIWWTKPIKYRPLIVY